MRDFELMTGRCPRCSGDVYVAEEEWVAQAVCDDCGYLIALVGPAGLPIGPGSRALGPLLGPLVLRLASALGWRPRKRQCDWR